MSNQLEVIDLDAERESRAGQREGGNVGVPVRFGGKEICVLPVELPIDVFAPLRDIDEALMLLLREAMQMATGPEASLKWEATEMVVNLLAASPRLPTAVVDVVSQIGKNLMTPEGFAMFAAEHPSKEDIAALVKLVFRVYGVSLGEALPSSDSSETGGGTSSTTSSPNSADSMPEASTGLQENPDS